MSIQINKINPSVTHLVTKIDHKIAELAASVIETDQLLNKAEDTLQPSEYKEVEGKIQLIHISTNQVLTLEQKTQLSNLLLMLDPVFDIQSAGFDEISPIKIGSKKDFNSQKQQEALYEYRKGFSGNKWEQNKKMGMNYYEMWEHEYKSGTRLNLVQHEMSLKQRLIASMK